MATVFMKWLETTPGVYDRGIRLLTLNKLQPLKEQIAAQWVRDGEQVLEIGCGTGSLAVLMARRGAKVTGVDASPHMLAEAQAKVAEEELDGQVALLMLDATQLSDRFEQGGFDVIVATLVFSELTEDERRFVLAECRALLAPGGRLIIADEVIPEGLFARLAYFLARLPLTLITWLLTRATTHPLRRLPLELAAVGFQAETAASHLLGSLELYVAHSAAEVEAVLSHDFPRLRHRVTPRTLLTDLLALFWRIMPPYPRVHPGLYRIGEPDRKSPVLVTGNFDLTVRRLVRAIDGKVSAWLLVANSAGINVWCAAGGGYFTAEKVIAAVKASHLGEVVDHHALILPQLCANGVDGWKIRKETGWGVHWGPTRASDIPAYLDAGRKKTDDMRQVRFTLADRVEMSTVTLFFFATMFLTPGLIFWRRHLTLLLGLIALLTYIDGIFFRWLPGRDGLGKGVSLAALTLIGLWAWSFGWGHLPPISLLNWTLGLGVLGLIIGGEFDGMTPITRGMAHMTTEGLVGLAALAVYGGVRLLGS